MEPDDRFSGVARLYGADGLLRLRQASVAVVGIGGVGSWTVEALARTGLGRLVLVDLDDICITNVNRQIHAVESSRGRSKAEAMAERVRNIHPGCEVVPMVEFFTRDSADEILRGPLDVVVDAIDAVGNKCVLISECCRRKIPVVVSGGAGGRKDPCAIRTADLALTTHDRLLAEVRSRLRKDYGLLDAGGASGIPAVFSTEPCLRPTECESATGAPERGTKPVRLNCDSGYGSACFVTGAFGFAAAAAAIRLILKS
ncbi:MAG: tRNA threonylcarbamoyladenosine dehydratase [Verrucomicrobia bacterium]|nr:tRNA threonylcarbamoyladenosine dehydratase [Verrucomicrobiota bacterium]